jgi:hypothetical protein
MAYRPKDFSAGLGAKICKAWCEAGGSPAELNKLAQSSELLGRVIQIPRGQAEVVIKKHIIHLAADPHIPEGWQLVEHQPSPAEWEWDPEKVQLHLEPEQQNGYIKGDLLRERLKGKLLLNARLLDYLFAHPELIPEEWKGRAIFFWGTVYRNSGGGLHVRYLRWCGRRWDGDHDFRWLGDVWSASNPAAVLAQAA